MTYLKGETELISTVFTTWWALWKAINNFILRGEGINPGKIIRLVQNIYKGSGTGEHDKLLSHPPVVARTHLRFIGKNYGIHKCYI